MLSSSCDKSLKSVCNGNVPVHLNINSMRSTFELLKEQIKDNVDILMISETKVYNILHNQFFIKGFSSPDSFRLWFKWWLNSFLCQKGCIAFYDNMAF